MAGARPGVHHVQLRPISVPESLTSGNKFIMFSDNSTSGTPVNLKVDEKGYMLYWKDQNKEMGYLDISLIKDTRTGSQVKLPKDQKLKESLMIGQMDVSLEDKIVTIVYGKDMVNVEYLHFVSAHKETAQEWAEELLKYSVNLLALNSSALTYLDKLFTRFSLVLDTEAKVSMKVIVKTITSNRDDRKKVEKALESLGFHAGKTEAINPQKFTFDNFFNFYRQLLGRTEVDKIFDELGAKKKPYLTAQQFCDFLNKQQRDPRLNEILYPNYNIIQAEAILHRYENKLGMAQKGHLSQEGFLKFLMSEHNNLIPPDKLDISEDMDQPLAHYFINSSHNTYLTGHQLTGKSTVEMYNQVLLSGCRCVELDCWDGKDSETEPIITHGYTMCTEILFKDVIEAIAQSAFKTSEFPVILSFENHCGPKQQAKMAAYCRAIFGDMLLVNPLDSNPLKQDIPLPSPNQLKRKIIIKNKKKHFHREKTSRKIRAQNMSKKLRQKQTATAAGDNNTSRTRLSEVEEDVELNVSPLTAELEELISTSQEQVSSPGAEAEPRTFTRSPLEKFPSISSEGPDTPDVVKEADDAFDSESDSSESDDDVISEEEKERLKKKQKNILTEEEKKRRQRVKKDKGTAGKEASAAMEMSLLVNYIQPVHFHSFEFSELRRRSFEITSFVETQGTSLLKEHPVEFVNYNKRQMSRIYPRGTRVDSSNFMPQVFWNAGCQLVALNFQTLDLAMQVNLGMFEYNGRTGYILKPDFMRRPNRHFDPFAESTVDGIIAGTVSVKIISGQFLSDKRVGTFVEVDMYGLPTDTVRKKFRTKTVPNNGLNPVYDEEPFVFKKVVLPNLATVRLAVYEDQSKSIIGHRVLPVEGLRPGYRHIPLRNECNQPLLMPTLFVHIVVKDYVPDALTDIADALFNPIAYQTNLEKHAQQLEILTEDFEEEMTDKDTLAEEAIDKDLNMFKAYSQSLPAPPGARSGSFGATTEPTGSGHRHSVSAASQNVSSSASAQPNLEGMVGSKPTYTRTASQGHIPVSRQDSAQSVHTPNSNVFATAPMVRMASGLFGQDNSSLAASIIQSTKLFDISLLKPTPITVLKTLKPFLKVASKRDREMEHIRSKQQKQRQIMEDHHQLALGKFISSQTKARITLEKHHSKILKKMASEGRQTDQKQNLLKGELQELLAVQDVKHREMKASYASSVIQTTKEHCQVELEVRCRYHEQIYDVLHQLMESNHSAHARSLDEIHDKEVTELKKIMDCQSREHMKMLSKKHKDKQELSRIKREAQQKHVQTAVAERQKLKEILEKRHSELEIKLAEVRKQLIKEREEALRAIKADYAAKVHDLEDELSSQIADDDLVEDELIRQDVGCPVSSSSSSRVSNGESTIFVSAPSKVNGSSLTGNEDQLHKINSKGQAAFK